VAIGPERRQVVVIHRDVQVEIRPRVIFAASNRARQPGGGDAGVLLKFLQDALEQGRAVWCCHVL
jgi:hypothetical protein